MKYKKKQLQINITYKDLHMDYIYIKKVIMRNQFCYCNFIPYN